MTKKAKSRRDRNARMQGLPTGKKRTAASPQPQPSFREAPIAQAVRLAVDKAPGQWDVLNDMYLRMRALMDHWINRAAPVLTDPVLLAQLTETMDYSALLVQFRCDMEQLTKELVQLHREHAGRTGGTDDPDENLLAAMLFERYVMWQLRHDQTLIPIVNHLLEFTHDAELSLARTQPTMAGHVETATTEVGLDDDNDTQLVEAATPRPETQQ
jgi:hypothetical protein